VYRHRRIIFGLQSVFVCLIFVSQAVSLASESLGPPASDPLALSTAVQIAMANNPGLAAKRAQAQAMAAIPDQAGALPDPMLMLNAMNVPMDTYALDHRWG